MMAARWAMLAAATLLALAALGAVAAPQDWQPSALRLAVTAVVGLLSLLFWPGAAHTPLRTAGRVAGWSLAAAGLAALVLWLLGQGLQRAPRVALVCAMLLTILLLALGLAAVLQAPRQTLGDARSAAEVSARALPLWGVLLLVLMGSLPLWLGPLAELLSAQHAWVVDAVIAASPLTHLAVASGNDLLRNQWFYQHSNLAGLQFDYPEPAAVFVGYALASLAVGLLVLTRLRDRAATLPPPQPT